jgi:hypothetical protein
MARKGNLAGIGHAPLSQRGDDLYETPPRCGISAIYPNPARAFELLNVNAKL